jgi:hypothetical protein
MQAVRATEVIVIPAQAGNQETIWNPAFAGVTEQSPRRLAARDSTQEARNG